MKNSDGARAVDGSAVAVESRVATVLFACHDRYRTRDRFDAIQEVVDAVPRSSRRATLLLFPAGWVKAPLRSPTARLVDETARFTHGVLRRARANITVCFGVNGRRLQGNAYDQLGVVVDATGVQAVARKFYAAPGERIDAADRWDQGEGQLPRTVVFGGRRLFVAVCYDVFGVHHQQLPRPPGVDGVLNLVHGFSPAGRVGSGDVLFARHGLAAAARCWSSPVFASASFFDREVPPKWPSGVRWSGATRSTMRWRYTDNALAPVSTWQMPTAAGIAEVREFLCG